VIGKADRRFWRCFQKLPASVQRLALEKYALWKRDPYHASLHFKERVTGFAWVASANTIEQPFPILNPEVTEGKFVHASMWRQSRL